MEGLLVAGHGSRDDAGVAECTAFVALVRALRPDVPVELGFIELAAPPLHDAVGALAAAGVDDVTVVPLVLLGAGHAKTDVPAALQRERAERPHVGFRYGAPLGLHPDLLAIVEERLAVAVRARAAADGQAGTYGGRDGVLLVGRGSTDPDANADLAKVARLVWEARPDAVVEHAFVSLTHPDVPAGLARCRRLGARHVTVVPYLLFTGVLVERITRQAGTHTTVTAHLGADERIARLVWQRYDEARAGQAHGNCDLCLYRTPMPGHPDRVGAPQTMHHHPHDPHPVARAHPT